MPCQRAAPDVRRMATEQLIGIAARIREELERRKAALDAALEET